MKKRLTCLLLAIVMVISVFPMNFMTASAAATMKLSDDGLEFIEDFIGFEEEAYREGNRWYIGYGTSSTRGATITQEKAETLLIEALAGAVNKVNSALSGKVVQKQFDALVALTHIYNIDPSRIAAAVTNPGTSTSEIANLICVKADGDGVNENTSEKSVADRLCIVNLFVNGVYDVHDDGNFGYTGFDARSGYFTIRSDYVRFQAYDVNVNNAVKVEKPVHNDPRNTFYGWFDPDNEDVLITNLNKNTDGMMLDGRWSTPGAAVETDYDMPASVLFAANNTPAGENLKVYRRADVASTVISYLTRDEKIAIVTERVVTEVIDGNDVQIMWVELTTGGWVRLGEITKVPTFIRPVRVSITDDYVNVRSLPNAVTGKILDQLERGDEAVIYMRDSANPNWGYCEDGWLLLIYTDFFEDGGSEVDDDYDTVIATAKVTSDTLNIRVSPTAGSARVGGLSLGNVVDVYEITTVAGHKWGRTAQGWICLTYTSVSYEEHSTGSSSTSGKTGVIVNAAEVNVRESASAASKKVGTVSMGTTVSILKVEDTATSSWAQTEYGWICMDYIRVNNNGSDIPYGKKAIVNPGISLAVRAGAGTEYMKITTIPGGSAVEIESTKVVAGVQWGKVAQGWINMSYVTMSNTGSQTSGIGGYIVNCSTAANVRAAAGTNNQLVGTIVVGSRVHATDRELVKGSYWYELEKGWVIADYVKLDSDWVEQKDTPEVAPIIPTIFNGYPGIISTLRGSTSVYETASSDAKVVMTIKTLTMVNIRERKLVGTKEFGKVIQGNIIGWVNMEDVLMSQVNAEVITAKAAVYEEPNVRSSTFASLPKGTVVTISPDAGTTNAKRGQIFDGSVLWGKITHSGKTGWIKMDDVMMFEDNKKPTGQFSKNGVGYIVGTTTVDTQVFNDDNGVPATSASSSFTLVSGQRIDILERFMVNSTGANFGKIKLSGTYYWVELNDTIKLNPVEMEVETNTLKAYNNITDASAVKNLAEDDIVTIVSRKLAVKDGNFNDWGRVYVNDDMTKYYWIILDEGKLDYVDDEFETPDERDVLVTVAVTTRTKTDSAEYNVYEEVDASSKVILKVKKNSIITVQNWKNVGADTWCKVKVGDIIGWMKMDDLDFSKLTGKVAVSSLKVYTKPDFDSALELYTVQGSKVTITEVRYIDNALWGKTSVATKTGWVNMAHIDLDVPSDGETKPVFSPAILTGKINSVDENVDVYPNINAGIIDIDGLLNPISVPKGTKVDIIDIKTVSFKKSMLVYKTCVAAKLELGDRDGWIEFAKITPNAAIATVNTSKIEVFTDLQHNKAFYSLYRDEKVNVLSFTEYENKLFGEVEIKGESGWILIADAEGLHVTLTPGSTNESVGITPTVTPTVSPTTPVVVGTPATIVCGNTPVNVRVNHEVSAQSVTTLANGTVVNVYEEAVSSLGVKWARIDQGWVCMDYVQYGVVSGDGDLAQPSITNTVPAGAIAVGYANNKLDVYGGPGYGYGKTGSIGKYRNLSIYERKLDGGVSWARTDSGWIILSYVTVTGIGHSNDGVIARTFFAANVRTNAGISGVEIAKAMVNAPVNIIETTDIAGETWARTDLGWISMNYIMTQSIPTPPIVGAPSASGDVG